MNRANSRASFDVVHVFLDAFVLLISFIITYSVFGRGGYTGAQWKAFLSLYLVCVLVFLLINNSLNIYNSTVFFYIDRIFKRETVAFAGALCCGTLIYFNVSDIRFVSDFIWWLLGISFFLLVFEIVFFKRIIDKFIGRKHVPRVLYVGSKDSYNKFRYFLGKTSTIINEIGYISFDDDDEGIGV